MDAPAPARPPRRRKGEAAPPAKAGKAAGYSMRGLQGQLIAAMGRDIIAGRYPPATLMPKETELTAQYGVSRTSVREAMKVLAAKGLIEIRQKIGTTVRSRDLWNVFDTDVLAWHHDQGLSEQVMRDLIELRQIIEPAAARFAAGRASMADLRRIERACGDMASNATSPEGYARSDVEFHMAVFAASHNALLARFGHLVADFLYQSFSVQQDAAQASGADFSKDAEQHRAVFDAINRGEPDLAARAMMDVILDGKAALTEAMETLEGGKSRKP